MKVHPRLWKAQKASHESHVGSSSGKPNHRKCGLRTFVEGVWNRVCEPQFEGNLYAICKSEKGSQTRFQTPSLKARKTPLPFVWFAGATSDETESAVKQRGQERKGPPEIIQKFRLRKWPISSSEFPMTSLQSAILALFGRRILGQYPAAPSSPGPFVLLLMKLIHHE